jgi:peptide/nickel transport system substrate-binding protein
VIQTVIVGGTPQVQVVTATPAPATAEPVAEARDTIIIGAFQEPRNFLDHANSQAVRVEVDEIFRPHFVWTKDFAFQPNPNLVDGELPTLDNGGAKMNDITVKAGEPVFSATEFKVISATEEMKVKQLVVTGKIKAGLKWNDGQPLTAKDFVFAWKTACDPDSGALDQTNCPLGVSPGSGGAINNVEATDDTTIVVTYVPNSIDSFYFTSPFGYEGAGLQLPLPEHLFGTMKPADILKDEQATGGASKVPLGWGAYKMVSWAKGDQIKFEPNENWGGTPAKTPNIVYKFFADTVALASAVIAGDVDSASGTVGVGIDQYPYLSSVAKNGDITLDVDKDSASFEFLTMNFNDPKDPALAKPHPLFSDIKVRQAVAMALDRQRMVNTIFYGQASVVEQPQLPQSSAYDPSIGKYTFDPDGAKKLLDEAGWAAGADGIREKDGVRASFTLLTTSGSALRQNSTQIIQANLKEVGIEVNINLQPSSVVFSPDGLDHRLFDMIEFANVFSSADPSSWFYSKFACNQIPTPDNGFGGANYSGWCNEEVSNAVINANFLTLDEAARAAAYKLTLEKFFSESYGIVPLFTRPNVLAHVPGLNGPKLNHSEYFTWNVDTWTLAGE